MEGHCEWMGIAIGWKGALLLMERGEEEYLREGDWITISFHGYSLFSQGLQGAELGLKQFSQASPIPSVFIVQAAHKQGEGLVHFGQKVVLLHLLSGKYLSYALHSSQEEVRLKYARTANCLFAIKPIFKCQGSFSRRIRRGEQVCLESGEGLRLCIELAARSQGEAACFVSMRKHEESILLVDRVNLAKRSEDQLTNMLVCQLSHLETATTLYARTLPEPMLHFSHDINQYDSFLTLEPSHYSPPIRQTPVSYGSSYTLRFFTSGYYLGFEQGRPCLSEQPNPLCEFIFQPYDDSTLKELSVLRVKHVESGLNVGVEKGQLRVGAFRLSDTFQLKRVDYGTLKVTLLVNELHASLQKLLAQRPLLPHRLPLEQTLKEMLRFSFPPNCTTQHFLRLHPLRVKLTAGEQKLLAEVGFISLIAGAVRELSEMGAGSEGGFYREAMTQLMMVLTSICLRNRENVQQLTAYLPALYESLGIAAGVPQALFFLFQDAQSLELLQRTQHKGRRGRIRSIELLLQHIEKGRNWDPQQRTHLLQLLECLIQPPNAEKLLLHEFSLLRAMNKGRLRSILQPMLAVGEEIEVELSDGREQLGDILSKRSRFGREGEAIRAQLRFYCALYGHPSSRVAEEFRNLVSEDVLLNYIKSNLGAEDICIFLRMLQDVYLHAVSVPTQSLIFLTNEVPTRSREYDTRMLEKLKSAVTFRISKSLSNELIDSATPLCIELMVRFHRVGLVERGEWSHLLELTQEYLGKNCEKIGVEGEVKPLALAIVKLMQYAEQVEVERLAGRMVERLREEGIGRRVMERIKEEVGGRLGLEVSHKAEEVVRKVLKEGQVLNQSDYAYLMKVIEHTLEKDIEIFEAACHLLTQLNTRSFRMMEQLKAVVLIEGSWSEGLVQQLQSLHGEVEELAGEYRRKEGEEERVGLSLSLAQKMKQVNEVFYRWDSSSPRHSVSPFVQNLMRETGFFQTVISFVKEQQRELRTARSRVFTEVFNFLLLLLHRNHSNLTLCISHFRLLRWLYTYDDHGQAKLLFLLAAHPTSRLALAGQLTQAALMALATRQPNPYAALSLLCLMEGEGKVEVELAEEVGAAVLKMGVRSVWKVGEDGWEWQADTLQKQNYCEHFGYYMFLIMRLFLLLAESTSFGEAYGEELRKYVRVDMLLGLLLGKDLMEECNLIGMGLEMMKEETMQIYRRFYEPYPRETTLTVFCNQLLARLLSFKLQQEVSLPDLQGSPDHVHALHAECLKIKHNQQLPAFPPTLHLLIVTIYYPFLLALTNALPASQRSQTESILGQAGRRLKELLSKLSRTDYHRHIRDYNLAVVACEEVLRYKLGYDLQQAKDESDKHLPYQFQPRLYRIQTLHNVVDNCQVLAESNPKSQAASIYKSILLIMHSPKIRQMLEAAPKVIKPLQQSGALQKLASGLERGLEQGILKGQTCLQLFWMLAVDHPHLMDFILHYDGAAFKKLQSIVVSAPDPSHRLLGKYLSISNQLLTHLINSPNLLKPNIFQDDPVHRQQVLHLRAALYTKLKGVMAAERTLYDERALGRQMRLFEEQCRLNCDAVAASTHAEQTLQFLANKFLIAAHGSKQILMPLLPDVLLLLRSYLRFVNLFEQPYLPRELHSKLQLCLRVLFNSLTPANPEAITLLLEGNYHQEFNRVLQLDDCWETARAQVGHSVRDRLVAMREEEKQGWQRDWLTIVIQICEKSEAFYGEEIAYDWAGFPLQPISSLFGPLKRSLMLILNQLKMSSLPAADEILLSLSSTLIHQNVAWIYRKHHILFKNFHLSTLAPSLDYPPSHPLHSIADTLCFQNGLDLTALTLYLGTVRGDIQLQLSYAKYWQGVHSFRGLINRLGQFLSDLGGLCCGTDRGAQPEDRMSKIYEFFYSKMGRVQILAGGGVVQLDFLIRPQCRIHEQDRENFMGELNFVSTQLKLESIARSALRFHLLFDEYCKFQTRFRKAKGLLFMDEYLIIIKLANLVLVYLDNFYLLLNSGRDQENYYSRFKISDPFQIFLLMNFTITLLYFLLFSFKNVPILAAQFRQEQEWTNSTRYQQYSPWRMRLLLVKKVLLNYEFIYSLVYLLIMALVFVNKVVVAVLVLDLFIQIPQMRTLLLALWRAKVQIVLAFISFLLIHYFYSIFTYFIFESHVQKFCGSLGECFGYIFNLVYREVGGFPGYIYEKWMLAGGSSQFDIYVVFMDVYLILTYQIFSSVIIVIIIDSFSKISRRNAQRKETLSLNCLVCGLSRTVFNTSSTLNFKTHVAVHHNVWNYLYYYHYLQNKRQMERNAHEWGILLQSAPDWLPNDCAKGFKEPT